MICGRNTTSIYQVLLVVSWTPEVVRNRDPKDADFFKPTKQGYLKSNKVLDAERSADEGAGK
jgi:hypothetical protein